MDEEEDISKSGQPGPEDDPAGERPFLPNDLPEPEEEEQPSPDDLADDAEEAAEGLEEAVESLGEEEQPEDPEDVGSSNEDGVRATAPMGTIPPPPPAPRDQIAKFAKLASVPGMVAGAESPPPSSEEMAETTAALDVSEEEEGGVDEDFGEQVNAFNDAGGADGGGDSGIPGADGLGGSGGGGGSVGDFADSVVKHSQQSDSLLIDAIRNMDDLRRKLEIERL